MFGRLTSFLLIAVLASATLADAPAHSGGECQMHGAEDCCEAARSQEGAPAVLAARLCCALNCAQPAPTTSAFAVQSPQAAPAPPHAAAVIPPPPALAPALARTLPSRASPPSLRPTYIQHLALLI